MKRSFRRSVNKVLGIEGGFSDHPHDSGGATKFGITEEVARDFGYEGDMQDLDEKTAKNIYEEKYWDENSLERVAQYSEDLAFEVFDTAVNCGSSTSVKFLQRALNVFNLNGELYEDLDVDGIIGDKTITALAKFHEYRSAGDGCSVLVKAVNAQQGSYYIRLAENNPKNESFVYGWIKHRI